jgi:TonB family protein
LFLLLAAFKIGWDLTPWYSAPADHQAPVQEAAAAPATPEATAPAPSAAPTAELAPTPTPASSSPKGGIVKGSVVHQALPDIPSKILDTIHGHIEVGIRVEVDAQGNVSQASIDSPGTSSYFTNQALHAAQNWNFVPAQVDGSPAASTWLLQFQFDSSQTAVTQTEKAP